MSIETFFDHTCSIYHLEKNPVKMAYGIKVSQEKVYEKDPETGIPCHFYVKSDGTTLVQEDPYTSIEGTMKLALPAGTDIRINDKVAWEGTGLCYRAGQPRNIRDHHISVMLYRFDEVKGAI